jgi:hypothetical protein
MGAETLVISTFGRSTPGTPDRAEAEHAAQADQELGSGVQRSKTER